MCLTPREVTAGLPSPILHHQVKDDEAFISQAVGFFPPGGYGYASWGGKHLALLTAIKK